MKKSNYAIPQSFSSAHIDNEQYKELYLESINFPEIFWDRMATKHISWYSAWKEVCSGDFCSGNVHWFSGAKLNVSYKKH